MSVQIPPPRMLVPESAPFTPEQRAWLNGFFAAVVTADGAPMPLTAAEGAALMPEAAAPALADNDSAPWHDPSLPLDERLAMAAGRPLAPRLMAAMAQQDCGQCGYSCADYANALFLKKEERLTLCAPGGKETARMLRQLAAEIGEAPAAVPVAGDAKPVAGPAGEPGRSRDNPAEAAFLSRRRLNGEGSAKTTWHVEFDLAASGLDYAPGDSFGVFPKNPPALADQVIAMLGARPEGLVRGRPLRDVLIEDVGLGAPPDALFQLFSYVSGGDLRRKARALANGEDPDGDAATLDVLAALHKFPGVRPGAEAFVEALEPLQPRLYSISSSLAANPGRVSLTVDTVRYRIGPRERLGVASTFLGERLGLGETLRVYVQKAHGFRLPADPATPVIMIGPGTGVAPFRAFLQERRAVGEPGRNWLFFGHQRRDHDFFYEDEFAAMRDSGLLTRLSLAWSRDGREKFYVQDRMREVGAELWRWIAEGAHLYVCGDARRMARDVERALVDIVAEAGARSAEEAAAFVAGLKKASRYQADVY
ncbi:sulfite reductase subunit alpha [Labrys wisconsinensis]|uniref:Sulfite reductase (NADPH) flavoprotein alpha-component n=1 Tax=Labrys wisconsinensis TaxID=425677 RepID=A0ABU0J1I0_9HYPH|nr:sulfite reductase subunit alpha [Labrys wisconsinensis]MDQ0468110.1 sulfite reductase (NADPH) flavoprotein alpha-component [Labrys wisconsinensis]